MQQFPFEEIDGLYRDVILNHFRNSRSRPQIDEPDIEYDEYNPICGDRVVVQLKLEDGRIGEAGFHGEGCSISQASASMLMDLLGGRSLEEAGALAESFRQMMRGATPPQRELAELGELMALQAVRKFPVRIKCALLPCVALEEGISQYRAGSDQE